MSLLELKTAVAAPAAREPAVVRVAPGEIFAVIGPNGAGKTRLLETIAGLRPCPAPGELRFEGRDATRRSALERARLGMRLVRDVGNPFPRFTVRENLAVGAWGRDDAAEVGKDMRDLFRRFPLLEERASQRAGTLSGGEAKLLALARAVLARPKLLLLDEPLLGLMPENARKTFDLLRDLRSRGQSVILVEQDPRSALGCADRAALLVGGAVLRQGTAAEMSDDSVVAKAL